jgi:hypothetical protein
MNPGPLLLAIRAVLVAASIAMAGLLLATIRLPAALAAEPACLAALPVFTVAAVGSLAALLFWYVRSGDPRALRGAWSVAGAMLLLAGAAVLAWYLRGRS